ncbi:OLC1v1038933C3 [Oldenlandia corymbosa var. corymbosa]|nr:OLC1v1038933C3 [Oldenlandia corymbosa var. corymbosa]
MALHRCSNIDKLSIRLNLRLPNVTDLVICDWIQFAVQRQVRVLELEASGDISLTETMGHYKRRFMPPFNTPDLSSCGYNFPVLGKLLTFPLTNTSCFASLTSLKLVNFNIDDETMDYILSNCSFLERLYLKGGTGLRNLSVVNSPFLKYLTLGSCWDLKALKISGAKLVYFEYKGYRDHPRWMIDFCFENVPLLSEVIMDTSYFMSFLHRKEVHEVYSNQLEKVAMHISRPLLGVGRLTDPRRQIQILHCLLQENQIKWEQQPGNIAQREKVQQLHSQLEDTMVLQAEYWRQRAKFCWPIQGDKEVWS